MRRRALLVVLLPALLAGCGSDDPTFFEPERPIQIEATLGERSDGDVAWHVTVANGGSGRAEGLSLHLSVRFNNAQLADDTAGLDLPPLAAGARQAFVLKTPYRGFGDYSGPVEVWQGELRVARNFVFFEDCGNC